MKRARSVSGTNLLPAANNLMVNRNVNLSCFIKLVCFCFTALTLLVTNNKSEKWAEVFESGKIIYLLSSSPTRDFLFTGNRHITWNAQCQIPSKISSAHFETYILSGCCKVLSCFSFGYFGYYPIVYKNISLPCFWVFCLTAYAFVLHWFRGSWGTGCSVHCLFIIQVY